MQLTIDLPESFVNHRGEIIVLTLDEECHERRRFQPGIVGRLIARGDLPDGVPADTDWQAAFAAAREKTGHETENAVVNRLRARFAHVQPGESMATELIAERRQEVLREDVL